MRKPISFQRFDKTLSIAECYQDSERPKGYWIYDTILGYNIVMGEPDKDMAFFKAIKEYQKRYNEMHEQYYELLQKVHSFVDSTGLYTEEE